MVISLGILSILIMVLLMDIIPIFKDWLKRIHIGRFTNEKLWKKEISDKAIKWLNKTPSIKVTDNQRLIAIDMLKGNYKSGVIQHWQEAGLLLGLSEYLNLTEDKRLKKEINKFINSKFDKNGNWIRNPQNIDVAILGYAIMKLDFINIADYKPALDTIWKLIKDHIGNDGTVEYRSTMKKYRYVDTIGFICPFLVSYGIRFDVEESIHLAIKQIKEYEKYGMLNKHYLPCHAINIENKLPVGLYGWGRGLGWFAIGIIDTWDALPKDHPYKFDLEEIIKKFTVEILKYQQKDGNWNWAVNRKESRADSSTTATLGWFLVKAAKIKGISIPCQEGVEKSIKYLMKVTRKNGEIDFSQGDTKDIGVYSMSFNILPFTQGFSVRLMCFRLRIH
ncbi:glycoside hydrolase family 88 protein [Peribacillus muralis]|uniref:glycoside hydrolase family 88 protein n=1 Tax=Peribacillus muralis TaxID=264697 RepID=UPI00070DAE7A|nr:glycoside hydrolase family 88 protein [Peribacillus muralis]